jgi:hypothetical protein
LRVPETSVFGTAQAAPHQSAPGTHQPEESETEIPPEVADLIGGGGWTRTNDLRIMSHPAGADSKPLRQDGSADSGKVLQNPQPRRNKTEQKEED